MGGNLKDFNLTMGVYDCVATLEAKDDELVAKYILATKAEGNVKTVTLRAFTEEEYRGIIKG